MNNKVLCVDDDPEMLELLGSTLESLNIRPLLAVTAERALELVTEHGDIRLVISDFQMPDMDGIELRRRMLKAGRVMPFALLSGFVTREMSEAGFRSRVCAILDKPFTRDTIKEFIGRLRLAR